MQRANIQDTIGKSLAQIYGFQATPTFILFDTQSKEVLRSIARIEREKVDDFLGTVP